MILIWDLCCVEEDEKIIQELKMKLEFFVYLFE